MKVFIIIMIMIVLETVAVCINYGILKGLILSVALISVGALIARLDRPSSSEMNKTNKTTKTSRSIAVTAYPVDQESISHLPTITSVWYTEVK
jgi:hypothetical protein